MRPSLSRKKRIAQIWRCFSGCFTPTFRPAFHAGRPSAGLQATLREWAKANAETVSKVQLIFGFGYDPSTLAERRHPTRDELDAISTEIPVYIVHQSAHLGVANTRALELAGITAQTENPAGGIIRHRTDGEPDGVLEETAHMEALGKILGGLGPEAYERFAEAGSKLWALFGYTTGQEGRSLPGSPGKCPLRHGQPTNRTWRRRGGIYR
jgi:predicted amidohydrolase YtcJ